MTLHSSARCRTIDTTDPNYAKPDVRSHVTISERGWPACIDCKFTTMTVRACPDDDDPGRESESFVACDKYYRVPLALETRVMIIDDCAQWVLSEKGESVMVVLGRHGSQAYLADLPNRDALLKLTWCRGSSVIDSSCLD